jgi:peptidoglycan/LPS O-acetylase OafA/YrhL
MNTRKLISSLTAFVASLRYGDRLQPLRDWHWLISAAFILLIGCASWSYYVFESTSVNVKAAAAAQTPSQTAAASVQTIEALFSARAAERTHYMNDYHFVDPSL